MTADPHTNLICMLTRLEQVLVDEDAALRRFDPAGISEAAERKAQLEPELQQAFAAFRTAPTTTRKAELATIRERIATRGQANLVRLQASMQAVRAVVDEVTGRNRVTYGRVRNGGAAAPPVLASEVG